MRNAMPSDLVAKEKGAMRELTSASNTLFFWIRDCSHSRSLVPEGLSCRQTAPGCREQNRTRPTPASRGDAHKESRHRRKSQPLLDLRTKIMMLRFDRFTNP